jgi:hypothetical protein
MSEYVEDREYVQPESDTVDWLVYAEYVAYQLSKIREDAGNEVDGMSA